MRNKPLLSICIPTYNRKKYLKKLLNNIFSQKFDKHMVEVVISDNNSNDGTHKVVDSFLEKKYNIVYKKNISNVGFDKNVFNVINLASGKYCWLFGDDDIIIDGSIAYLLTLLLKNPKLSLFLLNYINKGKPIIQSFVSDLSFNNSYDYIDYIIKKIRPCEMDVFKLTFLSSLVIKKKNWDFVKNKKKYIGTGLLHTRTVLDIILKNPLYFVAKPLLIQNDMLYRGDYSIPKEYLVAKAWVKIYFLFSKKFSKHRLYFYKFMFFHYIEYLYKKFFLKFRIFRYLLGLFRKLFSPYFNS